MRRNPPYPLATMRCTYRASSDAGDDVMGIALDLDDGTIQRVGLQVDEAQRIAMALLQGVVAYRERISIQLLMSSDNPSELGSPQEGQLP